MAPTDSDQGWSEAHGSAVREAAPEVPAFTASEQTALWHRIETTTPSPRPRRSRWKVVVAGLVAAGVVGVAGAAAGNVFSAHTGEGPVDAEDAELGGPGERLDPRAPDYAAVVDEATADIEFPSAQSRERALSWEIEDAVESAREEPFLVTTGALRLWTAGHALCSWSDIWAVALRAGDTAAAGPRARTGEAAVKPSASRADVEELYRLHSGEIRGYLYRRAGQAGADLLGEVFVVALQRLDDLPEPAVRRAWLFGTARRLLLAAQREYRHRHDAEAERARYVEPTAATADGAASERARAVRDSDLQGKNARFVTPPDLVALVEWADKVLSE